MNAAIFCSTGGAQASTVKLELLLSRKSQGLDLIKASWEEGLSQVKN